MNIRFKSIFNTDTRCSVDGRKPYENHTKTISVNANRFENEAKQYRFHAPFLFENGVVRTGSDSESDVLH